MKRVFWTFLCVALCALGVQAALQNEWTFETDTDGLPLTSAANTVGTAQFAASATNFQSIVYTASASAVGSSAGNRALLCVGAAANTTGSAWTAGAILNAALTNTTSTSITSGRHYLRYDVAYSLSTSNNSGMVLGAYFTGMGGVADNKAAGFVLGYDKNKSFLETNAPPNRKITPITVLNTDGSLIAIAEVNLDAKPAKTLKVWYSVNGSTPADYSRPAFTTNIQLTSISNLGFRATGTFRSPGSTNYAAVDNLRMADTWEDITATVPNFSKGPQLEIARVIVTTPNGGTITNSSTPVGTARGVTNTVNVVIRSVGSPASSVTSSVASVSSSGYFSIIPSNAPGAVLPYPQYVTNTFSVIVKTTAPDDTNYVFNLSATAAGASAVSTNFSLTVGALIAYQSNSITEAANLFGGVTNGLYEPGEVIDITVSSKNTGTRTVSDITNSLSADPAFFTISNLTSLASSTYSSMTTNSQTSTVYRVTILDAATNGTHRFLVANQSGSFYWSDSFLVNVSAMGVPSVSPGSIKISNLPDGNLLAGTVAKNTQVVMTNAGTAACTFHITDDGVWDVSYDATTGTLGATPFATYNNVITLNSPYPSSPFLSSTNAGVSSAISLGFDFPFYGTTYSNIYVTADGYIGLINDPTNIPASSANRISPLPVTNTTTQIIAPFWGTLSAPEGSIRYDKNSERLALSYDGVKKGASDLAFQVALFTDGRIEFRYKTIAGVTDYGATNVTIGIQGDAASYTNLAAIPGDGTSVTLTPQTDQWVSYATQEIGIDRQSSVRLSFTADASKIIAVTSTTFKAWFNWSTGGSNSVAVSVSITNRSPIYSAVKTLSFAGAAGQVTSALFVITNAGTSPLTFTISDNTAAAAGYTNSSAAYSWIDCSAGTDISGQLIAPAPAYPPLSAANDGFTAMIPLQFAFPFYAGSYTQFCVSVNGALRLDTSDAVGAGVFTSISTNSSSILKAQIIAPYAGDLVLDANTTIKYLSTADQLVISWENIQQYGPGGGLDQTFQAILKPSGDITFQYKNLEGSLVWPYTPIGLRDTNFRILTADIRQPSDQIVSTNLYGTVSTQYVNAVGNCAVQFRPKQLRVIGYSPDRGSIEAGSNAVITITGDASNQTPTNNGSRVSTNVTLTIVHNVAQGLTNTVPETLLVTFAATNSTQTAFVRAAAELVADTNLTLTASAADTIAPAIAVPVLATTIERTSGGNFLSWTAPSTNQYIYTIYSRITLMLGDWNYLGVTNGTTYLDKEHSDVPAVYYKITAEEGF